MRQLYWGKFGMNRREGLEEQKEEEDENVLSLEQKMEKEVERDVALAWKMLMDEELIS